MFLYVFCIQSNNHQTFCTYFVHILYIFCTEGDGTNDMKMTYRPLLSVVQDFLENKNLTDHWSWTYKQYMVSAASMDGMINCIIYDYGNF